MEEFEDFRFYLTTTGRSINPTVRTKEINQSEEHLAFIPDYLNDNVITLNATTLSRTNMKTVFIGITTTVYTPSMCAEDLRKWMSHFQLLQQDCVDVKMQELQDSPGKIDCAEPSWK